MPCKHIFAVRKYLNMSIFESSMINKRWLKSTIDSTTEYPDNNTNVLFDFNIPTNISSTAQRNTTKSQSYNEVFRFTQEIAQIVMRGTPEQVQDKFEVLKILKEMWETGLQVHVKPVDTNIDDFVDDFEHSYNEAFSPPASKDDNQSTTSSIPPSTSDVNIIELLPSSSTIDTNSDSTSSSQSTTSSLVKIGTKRKSPIDDDNQFCKQVKRLGRPTNQQLQKKDELLKSF